MEILNGYLARMAEVVIAHGGTINEFIGDAIFAVYGAPVPHPDHAERAAATALAMQAALGEINAEHARRGLPAFEMGIGLHTGEAVVGNIGSEQRAKYAVVGSAVNVASRVESATVGGPGPPHGADAGRAGIAGPGRASDGPPGEGPVRAPRRPRAPGARGPVRARAASRGAGGAAPGDRGLPLECWVIDGKIVRADALAGRVVRLEPAGAPRAAGRAPGAR